ncbi:MAG TPA: ribonuclease HII [Alphaproteobacteria bacterium]|nr:ribonuclease HII [Alphaproteobacteria bacterium]
MADKFIAGVDEAGRGPLIGPLVICVAAIEEENHESLRAIGVKDSKLLTPKQREHIFEQIQSLIKYELIVLDPATIDAAVGSETTNLNWLEADNGAFALDALNEKLGKKISKCIIDCPSTNLGAFKSYLSSKLKSKIELQVEHKADLNNLIVGAASIMAKETRERILEEMRSKLGVDFGSGYPADPKTKEFIEKYHSDKRYNFIFRKSWETYKKISRSKAQTGLEGW